MPFLLMVGLEGCQGNTSSSFGIRNNCYCSVLQAPYLVDKNNDPGTKAGAVFHLLKEPSDSISALVLWLRRTCSFFENSNSKVCTFLRFLFFINIWNFKIKSNFFHSAFSEQVAYVVASWGWKWIGDPTSSKNEVGVLPSGVLGTLGWTVLAVP